MVSADFLTDMMDMHMVRQSKAAEKIEFYTEYNVLNLAYNELSCIFLRGNVAY